MRCSGILMHISSLPSPYGIGTLGTGAYDFVDFLVKAGQRYWQTLPVCPTSYGDSPYQSFSTFAGNPYFIDLNLLVKQGLLEPEECEDFNWGKDEKKVEYGLLHNNRFKILRTAFLRFIINVPDGFKKFCDDEKSWLDDYSLFMALKDAHDGESWDKWEMPLKMRDEKAIFYAKEKYSLDIVFYQMLQYMFFEQWMRLKKYANKCGIKIIGDLPIYVAKDSADVWAKPKMFMLDEKFNPIEVSGCPPDSFTQDGQLWGNPLYDWEEMKNDDYKWWADRILFAGKVFDVIRIDHFRGFDSYYAIPAGSKNAKNGIWRDGPGIEFVRSVKKQIGKLSIIAEDLGYLTDSVRKLLKDSGFPGMKVLQFAFDSREDSDYLPHNYIKNCIVYTGTHDNDTILGWMQSAEKNDVRFAKNYLRLNANEGYNWGMMKAAWACVADTAIVQMQDVLGLDSSARMNTPSTTGENWKWRATNAQITDALAKKIYNNMKTYRRLPGENEI